MSKEKALAITEETFRIFQEKTGISFEDAFTEAKRIYGIK